MTNTSPRYGAQPGEWRHFALVLGLTEDLLPVVSNPQAQISPDSKMGGVGKTPSRYNHNRLAAGIPDWTQRRTSAAQIKAWQEEPDYGICIQTRRVRALDFDITDPALAARCREFVRARGLRLPCRSRANSPKFLLAFETPGELYKRRIKTAHGIIELLATGQQFIASGLHPSGVRYAWENALPDALPVLAEDDLNELWQALQDEYGIEDDTRSEAPSKHERLAAAIANDPVAQLLSDKGMVKRTERDGRLHITCPFEHEHTSDSGDSSTTYWPAHTGGYNYGHFHCLHAHCEDRSDQEFKDAIGYVDTSVLEYFNGIADAAADQAADSSGEERAGAPADASDFDEDGASAGSGDAPVPAGGVAKFAVIPAAEFAAAAPTEWLVKHILPTGEVAVVYGDSGTGKSFLALDLGAAIATGEPWRGNKVRKGRVVYVAAEGAGGVRKRFAALAQDKALDLSLLDIGVIAGAPSLLKQQDVRDLILAIKAGGECALIVIDTLAQVTAGSNENSGEDMGKVLSYCKIIHQKTGALVLLVHHAGKDTSKGARGWSGLRNAVDTEIEVIRDGDARAFTIAKQKDGEDGREYSFRLNTVVLGTDADGEDITSCVVEHLAEQGMRLPPRQRSGKHTAILDVFNQLADLGDGRATVAEVLDNVVASMPQDAHDKRDTRRQLARRSLNQLIEAKRLRVEEGTYLVLGDNP